jgi:hypothetical protein
LAKDNCYYTLVRGRTWNYHNKLYTKPTKLPCNIHGIYLQNLVADSVSQPGGPRVDNAGLFHHVGVLRKMQVKTDTLENWPYLLELLLHFRDYKFKHNNCQLRSA